MKRFFYLFAVMIALVGCQAKVTDTNTTKEVEAGLTDPFVHSVYFWFKEGVTDEQLEVFYADTEALREIEVVKAMYTGRPASTDRPIVERSYDFAVIVHFEDLAGHDVYQKHPTHLALLEKHSGIWERVMITDVE